MDSINVLSLKWSKYYKREKARLIHRKDKHRPKSEDMQMFYLDVFDILGVLRVQAMAAQGSTWFYRVFMRLLSGTSKYWLKLWERQELGAV